MKFLEKDLETIIFEATTEQLTSRGLYMHEGEKFIRQFQLPGYGIIDLLSYSVSYSESCKTYFGAFRIFELKQDEINTSTLLQVSKYIKGISRASRRINGCEIVSIDAVMIGKRIELKGEFIHLATLCQQSVAIYTYDYEIDGLKFERHVPGNYFNTSENMYKSQDDLQLIIDIAKHYEELDRQNGVVLLPE